MIRPPRQIPPGAAPQVAIPGEPEEPVIPDTEDFSPELMPSTLTPETLERLQPSTSGTRYVGGTAAQDRWNRFVEAAREEADEYKSRAIENADGIFYKFAPLGWEDAGQYVQIPMEALPEGAQPEVLWKLDPTAAPTTPTGESAIGMPVMQENQALKQFFMMSPTEQALIKSKLVQVGLLKAEDVGPAGVRFINDTIRSSWLNLVSIAQYNGRNTLEMLTTSVLEGTKFGSVQPARAPTIQIPSSDEVKQAANALAQREIGRRLTVEELDMVVKPYQQRYAQDARRAMGGGTVETPPSVGTFTEGVIGEEIAEEQELYSLGGTLDSFMGILGGGS